MRVSSKWLKEYVNINISDELLANKMIHVGNEVGEISRISTATNLVVGHVLKKTPHPNSDHLNICEVDLGDGIYQIVCGAKNVDANQKVIVAKVGAKLPNGINIAKSSIRGVESNGMICSLEELGIESKFIPEASKGGIHVLDGSAKIGIDALEYLGYNDTVIDYEITSNRSDLLSMLGMAYEVGAVLNEDVKLPIIDLKEIDEKTSDCISVTTETDNCTSYLSRIVKDVVIKESPNFIKSRLIASGIRPINNVVDISNYVMLEYGQPLHFFDYEKLGNKIVVRMSKEDEKITTLDNIKRNLINDIVITDSKESVAIAGVMGGISTEVTNNTRNILIEAAVFNPKNIRITSKRVLRSEASQRFEKGIDSNRTKEALNRAAYLLQEYASGKVLSGIVGFDNNKKEINNIVLRYENVRKILGMNITESEIKEVFDKLKFTYKDDNTNLLVNVPSRRLDITIEEDLIEEIGRIYGYDNMKGTLPKVSVKRGTYKKEYKLTKTLHKRLRELGLNQVITYSLQNYNDTYKFTNDEFDHIELLSPLSEDKKVLRYSLLPSLLRVIEYNISRNIKDINIYEIGKGYYKVDGEYRENNKLAIGLVGNILENSFQNKKINADFYLIKGMIENILNNLGLTNRYKIVRGTPPKEFHPGISAEVIVDNSRIGYIGRVNPKFTKGEIYFSEIDLDMILKLEVRKIKFKEIPKYPSVVKDMAFIFDKNIIALDVVNTIKKSGGRTVTDVDIFDIYEGPNIGEYKKSIAFKITFMDTDKTLTDEEVTNNFTNIINNIKATHNGELRDK